MTDFPVLYSDSMVKQRIEAWAEGLDFDPEEQIFMLLEDKFAATRVTILDACPEDGFVMLTVESDAWKGSREFALLDSGSLAWRGS
jgi:hypothetical protein